MNSSIIDLSDIKINESDRISKSTAESKSSLKWPRYENMILDYENFDNK